MTARVKIVVAAINAACLAVTLIYPSNTTPYAVLITIVPVSAWAFTTYEKERLANLWLCLYVIISSILSMLCIIFGMVSEIKIPTQAQGGQPLSRYIFKISDEAFLFASEEFDYAPIAIVIFATAVILMVAEIFATARHKREQYQCPDHALDQPLTINGYIEKKIGHIK